MNVKLPPNTVVVEASGGNILNVYTPNGQNMAVLIVDWDNIAENDPVYWGKAKDFSLAGSNLAALLKKKNRDLIQGILKRPLSERALRKPHVEGIVKVDLNDIIGSGLEAFLDLLWEKLSGSKSLYNLNYKIVGHVDATTLLIHVSGDTQPKE